MDGRDVTENALQEIAMADFSNIRFLNVPLSVAAIPQGIIDGAVWNVCNPRTANNFSAIAYFFAQSLYKSLSVPIGIISSTWPGAPMEVWTSIDALKSSNTFQSAIEAAANSVALSLEAAIFQPTALFNGMIAPFIPFTIRGVIWYQGESNIERYSQYLELSKLMINDWRKRWGQGNFPFFFAQLSGWKSGGENLPLLREAQLQTLELPNTGMVVTTDLSGFKDCHPVNKQEIGYRFSLLARNLVYDEKIEYSGPKYKKMKIEKKKFTYHLIM